MCLLLRTVAVVTRSSAVIPKLTINRVLPQSSINAFKGRRLQFEVFFKVHGIIKTYYKHAHKGLHWFNTKLNKLYLKTTKYIIVVLLLLSCDGSFWQLMLKAKCQHINSNSISCMWDVQSNDNEGWTQYYRSLERQNTEISKNVTISL